MEIVLELILILVYILQMTCFIPQINKLQVLVAANYSNFIAVYRPSGFQTHLMVMITVLLLLCYDLLMIAQAIVIKIYE